MTPDMTPRDPLDSRLDSASGELRSQLGSGPLPDFEPNPRVAAPVAAIVAVIIAVGALAVTQFGSTSTSQVEFTEDTADTEQVEAPEPDAAQETVAPDTNESGRTSTELVTGPDDVQLTIGQDNTQPAADRVRPAIGERRNDPAYNTVVTRLTNAGGRFNRIDSPHRSLVNSDGTLLLTHADNGTIETMNVLDLDTLETLVELDIEEETEIAWHPTDPAVVRHLSGPIVQNGSLQLLETNVLSEQTTVLADLTERVQELYPMATFMVSGHGRPGNDGNSWAWIIRDESESSIGAITYDLGTDTITGSLDSLEPAVTDSDFSDAVLEMLQDGPGRALSIAMAPNGNHVVIEYTDVAMIHDSTFTTVHGVENSGDSGDVVALENGGAAYVYVDFTTPSNTNGFVTSVDLITFERTTLINLFDDANTSMQVSGTALNAPGWVLASSFSCKNSTGEAEAWTCNKVMMVEIGGQNRVVPLAHTYGCTTDEASWFTIPNATADADLTRIFFTSDSGACTEAGEVFEITVPPALREIVSGG